MVQSIPRHERRRRQARETKAAKKGRTLVFIRVPDEPLRDPEGDVYEIPTPIEAEVKQAREETKDRLRQRAQERGEDFDEDGSYTVHLPMLEATLPLMLRAFLRHIPAKTKAEKGVDGMVRRVPENDYRDPDSAAHIYDVRRACVNPVEHEGKTYLEVPDDAFAWLKATVREEGGYVFGPMVKPLLDLLEDTRGKLHD